MSTKGGGAVLDLIHDINYPSWILEEPISLLKGFVERTALFDMRSEAFSEGIFESKNKTLVSVHQDYIQPVKRRYCEIVGTRGTLLWDSITPGQLQVLSPNVPQEIKPVALNDMYADELSFFMGKVSEGSGYSNFSEGACDLKNALALKKYDR